MKQTAVEWYSEQSMLLEIQRAKGNISITQMLNELSNIIEQAKEMEKEQIIDFGYDIADDLACGKYRDKKAMEERYNEYLTFKQQEQ